METVSQSRSSIYDLIRSIGLPGVIDGKKEIRSNELEKLAALNKVPLLYSIACGFESDLTRKYTLMIKTLTEIGRLFKSKGIRYSVFKTLKPFPTTPSDIDVLLPSESFDDARLLLKSEGYTETASDAYSSTLQKEMIVDLQQQPSVSNVPYLPKSLLIQNTITKMVDGFEVCTLSPEAELVVIAAHSFYKEQMLTLNDYYSITILSEQADLSEVIAFANSAKVLDAIKIVVAVCSNITDAAFGRKLKISELADQLKITSKVHYQELPIKFSFLLVLRLMLRRARSDREMRQKIVPAIFRLITPRQFAKILAHTTRRTY